MTEDQRVHNPALGNLWHALTAMDPASLIPQVAGTVIQEGGTRPPWQWQYKGREYIAVAWPQDQPIRACVLMSGPPGEKMDPVNAFPLLEGFPNDLTIDRVEALGAGQGANIAVTMLEGKNPMWFFDPFYTRDINDLTPGVTQSFWLAACALGLRKAVLDHINIASGPEFDEYLKDWLEKNPDRSAKDAPPLKIDIAGKHFIRPGQNYGEYHLRATIEDVEDWHFDKMPIKSLSLVFPFENRPPLLLPLYVSQNVLGDYVPEKGQDIEAYVCLQGRIIDLETAPVSENK